MSGIRKVLAQFKNKTFQTNDAFWYCNNLSTGTGLASAEDRDITVTDGCIELERAMQWIREQSVQMPWIYVPEETEYATRYHHCYPLLIWEGEISGYIKIALKKAFIQDYEDEISLEDDEAFICDTFILPALRGRHLGRSLLSEALRQLTEIRFVFCHIPGWNRASTRLYQHLGFKQIGHIRYIRLLKLRFFTHNPNEIKKAGKASVTRALQT